MQKLVLAIIGVALLQVAFYVRVATNERSATDQVVAAKNRSVLKSPATAAEDRAVVTAPPALAPVVADSPDNERHSAATRVTSRGKARSTNKHHSRTVDRQTAFQDPVAAKKSWAVYTSSNGLSQKLHPVPTRASLTIPKGYTMVLVDYLPRSSVETMMVAERKGRSGKRLPAVIRKPWNFIKSVGSKIF